MPRMNTPRNAAKRVTVEKAKPVEETYETASNASSDYDEPHGFREHLEHRYRKVNRWIHRNRKLFDFVAYFFFLLVFTLVASEANPGEDLIEQVAHGSRGECVCARVRQAACPAAA